MAERKQGGSKASSVFSSLSTAIPSRRRRREKKEYVIDVEEREMKERRIDTAEFCLEIQTEICS